MAETATTPDVLLTAVINCVPKAIVFSLDRNYRYIAYNDRHRAEMLRVWHVEIAPGMNLLDLMSVPELREAARQSIDRALRGETFSEFQHQPEPSIYYELNWAPIRAGRDVVGVAAYVRDVTAPVEAQESLRAEVLERERSDARLRASESRYQTLYESMMDAYVRVDMSGAIVEFNRAYLTLLGYSADEIRQLRYVDITPGTWHRFEAKIVEQQVLTRGYSDVYEKEYRRKDGTVVPIELRTNLITDVAGRPAGMWAIVRDISARRQAEASLRESENHFRNAVQLSPFPMLLHAEDGAILEANDVWCEISGYPRGELSSVADWTERAYGQRKDAVQADIDALYALDGRKAEGDYTIRTRDGSRRIWDFSSAALGRLADGRRLVLSTAMDVTERREAEQEVRRLNAELEARVVARTAELAAAYKELEAFSYSVSHDLRAPLRAIDRFAHILLDDHARHLCAEGQRVLDIIRKETDRMGQLIDDLLEFSKVQRQPMVCTELDVAAMVRDVFEECLAQTGKRCVVFQMETLPCVYGDRPMIRQALVNLMSNALKFTAFRPEATVRVGGRLEGDEAVFAVQDNGAGFDMRYADRLFGVFQRLHSDAEFDGTGVGLALVQRIIQRHGGRVWAEGVVGEGATFYFALPAVRAKHLHVEQPPGETANHHIWRRS